MLDVGCGIGGPARTLARTLGCRVTGVDLTDAFVETAAALSRLVGATGTTFQTADATGLPFDDGAFDAATLIHVGMNIPDKPALLRELARVTRVGGPVAVYDIMRVGEGELRFPLPWATSPATSHLASPEAYAAAMRSGGLTPEPLTDRSPLVWGALAKTSAVPPQVHLGHLMGEAWPTMFANLRAALEAGVVAPVELVGRVRSPG